MSKLFGPYSVTTSRVSWRACALAGDHTAGMAAPTAAALADLRKSRRFIDPLPRLAIRPASARVVPESGRVWAEAEAFDRANEMGDTTCPGGVEQRPVLHTIRISSPIN